MYPIKQSTTLTLPFFVHDANGDAVTGLTNGSFTKRISKGSGAFGAMTVTITEMELGWYSIPLTATHSDTLALLTIIFTNAGAKQVNIQFRVEANLADDLAAVIAIAQADLDIITDSDGVIIGAAGIDLVWDEVLTGGTHNVTNSSGKKLRQLTSLVVRQDTAQGSGTGNNQIQLDTGASSTNGQYDPGLIVIEGGTGAGQSRLIIDYVGSTKIATVDRDWRVNPDATSEFLLLADSGRQTVNEGLAQAGTSSTITLNAAASSVNDAYLGQAVFIRSGTGQDQVGTVTAYNGTTKVATMDKNWTTTPDTTSGYEMLPHSFSELTTNTISDIITDMDANSTQLAAIKVPTDKLVFTVTNQLDANMLSISGDGTAADNLEASMETIVVGTATGTLTTTTMADTGLSEATDDHYIGRIIIWRTGVLAGQATDITDYTGTGRILTFTATTEAPGVGDAYVIL